MSAQHNRPGPCQSLFLLAWHGTRLAVGLPLAVCKLRARRTQSRLELRGYRGLLLQRFTRVLFDNGRSLPVQVAGKSGVGALAALLAAKRRHCPETLYSIWLEPGITGDYKRSPCSSKAEAGTQTLCKYETQSSVKNYTLPEFCLKRPASSQIADHAHTHAAEQNSARRRHLLWLAT